MLVWLNWLLKLALTYVFLMISWNYSAKHPTHTSNSGLLHLWLSSYKKTNEKKRMERMYLSEEALAGPGLPRQGQGFFGGPWPDKWYTEWARCYVTA